MDSYWHYQIVHCIVNCRIPPPLPFERNSWHLNRANSAAIKRSITSFTWRQHLNIDTNPNRQVKTFTDTFLNIMPNFIQNESKFVPRDPPWITKPLKTMLNRKNRFFNNYKKHGYKTEDKIRFESFRIECKQAVETSKLSYLRKLQPNTSLKSFWKIFNRVMNKCGAPKIPPLLVKIICLSSIAEKRQDISMTFFHNSVSSLSMIVYYPLLRFSLIRELIM